MFALIGFLTPFIYGIVFAATLSSVTMVPAIVGFLFSVPFLVDFIYSGIVYKKNKF